MTAQPNFQLEKSKMKNVRTRTAKANFIKAKDKTLHHEKVEAATKATKAAASQSKDVFNDVKRTASKLIRKAVKFYSINKAIRLTKSHPVQTAIGGVALGVFVAARLLGKQAK